MKQDEISAKLANIIEAANSALRRSRNLKKAFNAFGDSGAEIFFSFELKLLLPREEIEQTPDPQPDTVLPVRTRCRTVHAFREKHR